MKIELSSSSLTGRSDCDVCSATTNSKEQGRGRTIERSFSSCAPLTTSIAIIDIVRHEGTGFSPGCVVSMISKADAATPEKIGR